MKTQVDFNLDQAVKECAREPIHIPGSIQPMGFLLQYDFNKDKILALSQNISQYIDKKPSQLLGKPLAQVMGKNASSHLRNNLDKNQYGEVKNMGYKRLYRLASDDERDFVIFVNGRLERLIIEIEPLEQSDNFSFFDFASNVQESLRWMFSASEIPIKRVFDMCLAELKSITGFDRVMLYQLDEDYNGVVINEACSHMESYLGHHFPASDIPEQARALYLKNWIRLIPDVEYEPVPLLSHYDQQQQPIDLTDASFRSVSPIHRQYLRNMGVAASMSVSVIVDGRLWGLIAMHHPQPLRVSSDRRAAAQYTGQLVSMFIGRHERDRVKERQAFLKNLVGDILSQLIDDLNHFYGILHNKKNEVMELCRADGLMLVYKNSIRLQEGVQVNEKNIGKFIEWLEETIGEDLYFQRDRLPEDERVLSFLTPPLPGILAVPLLGFNRTYLIWFRKEQERELKWAGKPSKEVELTGEGTYRLSPRHSFDTWKEGVKGLAIPWGPVDIEMAMDLGRSLALLQIRHLEKGHVMELHMARTRGEYQLKDADRKTNVLNEQFKTVVESSPDALAAIDNNNRFMILNPRYQQLFLDQYGKEPQIGDNFEDLLAESPNELRQMLQLWEQVRKGNVKSREDSYRSQSGVLRYTQSTYNVIYGGKNMPQGILATIRDVTRTKEAEKEISELLQKYELLVKRVSPITWTANPDGSFTNVLPDWEVYTGQTYAQYKGIGWLQAIYIDDRPGLKKHWQHCLDQRKNFNYSGRIWNRQTEAFHHFLMYAIPIIDDQTEEVIEWFGFCIDIQHIREQEEKLENAMKALQTSNADLQHFAYVASHDLQEPLRMITSYMGLIEKRYNDLLDERGRKFMHYAVDGAHRMKKLIEELLTYSRVDRTARFEEVSLDTILKQVHQNLKLKIEEKDARIDAPALPVIRGVPVQLLQLFTNLVNNSLKFAKEDTAPDIRISFLERKLSWQFTFEDNGIGIDPKYAEKVFNIFFRLHSKQAYQGTGMGLAICHRVVNNHGGKIWIDTDYQEGTRFLFTVRKYLENEQPLQP